MPLWLFLVAGIASPSYLAGPLRAADASNDTAAENLLRKANGLYERQYFKQAADDYAVFLQQFSAHPQAPAVRFTLGICRYRTQEYAQAITDLTGVIRDAKFPQRDEALVVIGHCNFALKKYPEAIAAFDELIVKHPQSKQAENATITRAKAMYLLATQADANAAPEKFKSAAAAAEAFAKAFPQAADRPTALLLLGLSQRSLNQDDEAAKTLTGLLKDYPDSAVKLDATLALGQALEAQGKLEEAAERYRALAAVAPAVRQPEANYSLGAVLYRLAKYDEAAKAFSKAADADPKGPFAARSRLQLGLSYVAARKTAEARQMLEPIEKTTGDDAIAASYGLAQCDMADKKFPAAIARLDKLLKLTPLPANARQIQFDRAICFAESGQHDQAAKAFGEFASIERRGPQYFEAIYRQAYSLHQLGQYQQSHDLCAKVTDKDFVGSAKELDAENLFLLGNYPEAAKAYDGLLASAPDRDDRRARFTLRLGQCAYSQHDFAKAIELLAPLARDPKLAADPLLSRAAFIVGDALLQQEKYAEAARAFSNYITGGRERADLPEAQYKLAFAEIREAAADKKDPPASATRLLNAVAAGPENSPWVARAQFELGRLAYEARPPRLEEAAAAFKQVMAFDRGNPPEDIGAAATYFLGWLDFDRKDFKSAATTWADLPKRYAKSPLAEDAMFHRGVALRESADAAGALDAFTNYGTAYPQGKYAAKARHLESACLTTLGRHADARAILESLAREKNVPDSILYDLAWSQKRANDDPAAIATYQRLVKENPESKLTIASQAELAELLVRAGKPAEAIPLLEKVTANRDADPKIRALAMALLGTASKDDGKPEKALAAFAAYAKEFPDDRYAADALLQAGETAAAMHDFAAAQRSFADFVKRFPEHQQAPLAQLKLAEAQADAGQFDDSLATHEAFLKDHAKDPLAYRAHFGAGWALQNLKKYDQARAAYNKAIAATNTEMAARAQFQIGETYCDENNFEKAVPALLAVVDVYAYPKWSARALLEAGRASEHLNQVDRAKQYYGDVISKYKAQTDEAKVAEERLKAMK